MIRILLIIMFAILYMPSKAIADDGCVGTGANSVMTFTPEPIIISQSLPIGSILGEYEAPPGQELWNLTACTIAADGIIDIDGLGSSTIINGVRVFSTSVAGIGFAVALKIDLPSCPKDYKFANSNVCITSLESLTPALGQSKIILYKTGPTGSGIVSGKKVASGTIGCGMPFQILCTAISELSINLNDFPVTTLNCDVSTPTLTFNMGDIAASKFGTEPGTILTEDAQTQELGLRCDPNLNIMATLSGTQNPDTSDDTVLALTGHGTAGVAKGVGVQVVYNGEPLQREQSLLLKHTEGGVETFPITLRYYQTQPVVSPGTANATATLTLTYQ